MNDEALVVLALFLFTVSGILFAIAWQIARPELKRRGWRIW